ncbi:hypothetical protein FZ103_19090 [Streptomonospora sp. PA3]|uniref:DUF6177 family protein n=1 Tax=Streptomonospora sp. PA3 TaxID=2607326 RepID=UPI0012DC4273|nr:DUF6177 family protein [Streptomonospora sp. PA3]MUL43246.1 hypothetical protein [Streptomonospora sp. PA3]
MVADHPAIDTATEQAAVIVQDRPVVPLSSWLADALAACGRTERSLQVLTSPDVRITLPLRTVLQHPNARWAVEEPDGSGHYDGFSGVPLVWDRRAGFVVGKSDRVQHGPTRTFLRPVEEPGSQLWIDLRLRHDARESLVLGTGVELLAEALCDAHPAGWGTSEPALSQWNTSRMTALCRRRAPESTWTVFTGPQFAERPFIGTHRTARVVEGVKETITFGAGYPGDAEPPLERLGEVAGELAKRGVLTSMTVQRMAGRADLTYAPVWSGVPAPVGAAIGAEAVAEIGAARADDAPAPGERVGPSRAPAMWYPLGDGTDPDAWREFHALMKHLRPEGGQAPS